MKKLIFRFANSPLKILVAFILNILLVSLLYSVVEDISFADSAWWSIVTSSTVGYGDISPVTGFGQIISAYFILSNFLILGPLIIANIVLHLIDDKHKFTETEQQTLFEKIDKIEKLLEK